MTDDLALQLDHLQVAQELKCCKKSLVKQTDGKFQCLDCASVWQQNLGSWHENILFCCGNQVTAYKESKDLAAFYCNGCTNARQQCGRCGWMFHSKHNFYHHICHPCFDEELEEADRKIKENNNL